MYYTTIQQVVLKIVIVVIRFLHIHCHKLQFTQCFQVISIISRFLRTICL